MNRPSDPDALLRRWLDEGANTAPDRFVQAALQTIETTGQRPRRWTLLRRVTMPIHRFTLYGAAAAVLLVAAIGLAYVAGQRDPAVGDEPAPTATATPSLISSDQLEAIGLYSGPGGMGESTGLPAILGLDPSRILDGRAAVIALLPPEDAEFDTTRLTGARYIEFSGALVSDPRTRASVATYVALFETAEDAHRAYEALAGAHESPDGWNLQPQSTSEELGAERAHYAGPAYDRGEVTIHLWRERNAVLAAFTWDGTRPTILIDVFRRMDAAARRTTP